MNFTETVNNIIYKKIVKTVTVQDRAAFARHRYEYEEMMNKRLQL